MCGCHFSRLCPHTDLASRLTMDTIVCLASPHLGCRLLGRGGRGGVAPLMVTFGPSIMRAGLYVIKGKTGPDLLLDNSTLETLADDAHCAALGAFRRRILYCNGSMDWLVNAESASLMAAEECAAVLPASRAACRRLRRAMADGVKGKATSQQLSTGEEKDAPASPASPRSPDSPRSPSSSTATATLSAVMWQPLEPEAAAFEKSGSWPTSLDFVHTTVGSGRQLDTKHRTLCLKPLDGQWDPAPTAESHRTWDDVTNRRGRRAAAILKRIRSAGNWELHVCHFGKAHSSFAGGVFSPHIDIVGHPECTKPAGREVVQHLAALVVCDDRVPEADKLERL